jgi:hypothetical protein
MNFAFKISDLQSEPSVGDGGARRAYIEPPDEAGRPSRAEADATNRPGVTMSATRKILLVLSILIGGLALFQVYELTSRDSAGLAERDVERHRAELRALEAGEPAPGGVKLDDDHRRERIDSLRSWIKSGEEMAVLDREHARARWRNAILELMLAGGLAALVAFMGRKDGPKALVRLGQLRPGVIVAAIVGLVAGVLLVSFAQVLVEEQDELTRAEQRLADVQKKLESGFAFDAAGNIPDDQQAEFARTLSDAKFAPADVERAKEQRTYAALILLGSALALGLSLHFGRRSWRSFAPPPR